METKEKKQKTDWNFVAQVSLIVVLSGLLLFTFWKPSGNGMIVSASEVIPKGVPSIYGNELGISYDDVSASNQGLADATIRKLGMIDVSESLEGAELQRYINVLYNLENGISCEYCCGARSVIFSDGEPACGCAHSYAMRGLTKYLIKYHGSEFTDEQILEEVGKWKTLFFPGILEAKAEVLKNQGIELNYINLASNKYRGIEQGQGSGGMVGGC
ncbi:MAG: hypothetical protein Q8P15_00800 [Nanoarchaeota archaeon]|nr:hypothetical protein [Nanoarchaeota archaeon]